MDLDKIESVILTAEQVLSILGKLAPDAELAINIIQQIIQDFGPQAQVTDQAIADARAKLKDVPPLA